MKKFVQIGSTMNIQVTPDIRSIDATNYRSSTADRLNVKPAWTRFRVQIKQGNEWYPAVIKTWSSVQNLAKEGVLTIGSESDTCANQAEVQAVLDRIEKAAAKYDSDVKANKTILARDKQNAKSVVEDEFAEAEGK